MYSTTDNTDKSYLNDEYKRNRENPSGDPPIVSPFLMGNVLTSPRRNLGAIPVGNTFAIPESDRSRYDKYFAGNTEEELQKFRADVQPEYVKGLSALTGGILSGIGTFVEDVGYMMDLDTYKGMFTDIDHDATKNMGFWKGLMPNQFAGKLLQGIGKEIKEQTDNALPIYTNPAKDEGLAGQFFSWETLKSTIDSIVGFAAAGTTGAAGLKAVTKGLVKGLAQIGKYGEAVLASERLAALPSVASKLANGSNKLKRIEAFKQLWEMKNPKWTQFIGAGADAIMTKGAEARMEGLQSYESAMANLKPFIMDGTMTREEAEMEANKAGNHAFDMTMSTVAMDAFMLKGLFKPKSQLISETIMKPGLKQKATDLGKDMLGAPKEGLEEMWQQAAQMEGTYTIYQDIKDQLNQKQKNLFKQSAGFDVDKMPSNFTERTANFFDSTQAQLSGLIGMVSGPFQSALLSVPGSKERKKELKDKYNRQQVVYKDNEALFNAANGFADQVKVQVASKDLEKLAVSMNNEGLQDIAKEIVFTNIAAKNFVNGTHNQLRGILHDNNTSAESTKLLADLNSMEKDFAEAKSNPNAEEVFMLKREKVIQQKIVDNFTQQANNPNITDAQRKSYLAEAAKGVEQIQKLDKQLKTVTSKEYQMKYLENQDKQLNLMKVYSTLGNITSISHLEALAEKYDNDPVILQRINQLTTEGAVQKNTNKAEAPKTEVKSKPVKEETSENPYDKFDLNALLNKQKQIAIQEETAKQNNKQLTKDEKLHKKLVNEAIVKQQSKVAVNRNGITRQTNSNLRLNLDNTFNIENSLANVADTEQTSPTEEDYKHLQDQYDANHGKFKSNSEEQAFINALTKQIYASKNGTTSSKLNQDEISPVTLNEDEKELVAQVFELLSKDVLKNSDAEVAQEDIQEDAPLTPKEERDLAIRLINGLIDSIQNSKGIDIASDFNLFIQTFSQVNPELTKKHYNTLAGFYVVISGKSFKEIPETYEEAMSITTPDFTSLDDMPTKSSVNKVMEFARLYVVPGTNGLDIQNLYLKDIVNKDNLNKFPASSFAYLSEDWLWKYTSGKEVTRETMKGAKLDPNPLLNASKFNTGDKIVLTLDKEYDGKITLSSGDVVEWKELYAAAEDADKGKYDFKEEFVAKHRLGKKGYGESLLDYWPITISSAEDGVVAYVHTTAWINDLNSVPMVKDSQIVTMKEFRKAIIPQLLSTDNTPLETRVLEKVISIDKFGTPSGFVLNRSLIKSGAEALKDTELKFGISTATTLKVNGNKSIANNTINSDFLPDLGAQTIYVHVPLGKKNGKMQYWAEPVFNTNLNIGQAKTIRQAIEIFVKQDPNINLELYQAYLTNPYEKIDLLDIKGIDKLLYKLVYQYDSSKGKPITDYIKEHGSTNPVPVIEVDFKSNSIIFGSSVVNTLTKGQGKTDPAVVEKLLTRLFDNNPDVNSGMLTSMYFNINARELNSSEIFNYIGLDEKGVMFTNTGPYNEFIKPNISTFVQGTELADGSYGYTKQPIVRFDMNGVKQVVPETSKEEEPVIVEEIKEPVTNKMKQILIAMQEINTTIEERDVYLAALKEGTMTEEELLILLDSLKESKIHDESETKHCNL